MFKAAIYVRVSTEEQAKHGFSLNAQEDALKNYAKALGYEIFQIYRDEGKSAKNIKNRPAMVELLSDAERKKFQAIFIYKLDRFSRSLKDLILTIEKLKSWDIDFVSLQDRIETTSASGKLMFHIISAFAEFERNIIGERTLFGMEKRFSEGEVITKAPFGYIMANKTLVPCPKDSLKITEMYQRFLEGWSLNKLGREYGFSVNGIKKMLQNETYLGKVKFAGDSKEGNHVPLLSEELFLKVKDKLQ